MSFNSKYSGEQVENALDKILQDGVLTKNNTEEYIPQEDYHPATKKYVDDTTGNIETVVMTANDDVGPPSEYADVVSIKFLQGDLDTLKQLVLNKKYSQIIVNGVPCFGESNGNILVYMKESQGIGGRQYNVIAEINHNEIELYIGDVYFIYGRHSKPVMSLTNEIYLTQTQYDQLPNTKLTDGCTYYIVEG